MPLKSEFKSPVKYDMILAIRRIKEGAFSGLYEVVELTAEGSVKRVVTDANNKSTALGLMQSAAYKL